MTPNKAASALSNTTNNYSSASGSMIDVGLSVQLITQGKAVKIELIPDGNIVNTSYVGVANGAGSSAAAHYRLYRDATHIASFNDTIQATGSTVVSKFNPPGFINFTDYGVQDLPGTYVYSIQGQLDTGSLFYFYYCKLSVREIGL